MGLAAVCGPLPGGLLTHADVLGLSWRAVFIVNVPLGVCVILLASLLREDRAAKPPRLDLLGTVLVTVGAGLMIYPLIQGNSAGWAPWVWALLCAGAVTLALFGLQQRHSARRGRHPLVEPSLFRDRGFPAALTTRRSSSRS
jgi:MFS family permease